jgi:hypothetical protein
MTEYEHKYVNLLRGCQMIPGSYEKRFVRDLANRGGSPVPLTPRQRHFLGQLVYKYRRQLVVTDEVARWWQEQIELGPCAAARSGWFGNHIMPPSLWPVLDWNGRTVVKLAQQIRTEECLENLPILADALEDAGCSDERILRHCRGMNVCKRCGGSGGGTCGPVDPWVPVGEPHHPHCWVLTLILGRP